jgi:LPLT family lysophospholipid transporter-like MFS transporter
LIVFYGLAAWFNTRIPKTGVAMRELPKNLAALLPDFWGCNTKLWKDRLGQISLSTTTLFWGVSGNLRYIVLAWSAAALGYSTTQASSLVGVVAIGTAVGAVVASLRMKLHQATLVMPLGIAMGILVMGMNFIDNVWVAAPFLILLGALGGFLVVPMNALLQHRGHNLMGAGRSIAVQNFNEQACILLLGGLYSFSTGMGMSAFGAITAFGFVVASFMWLIKRWHDRNLREHSEEVNRLLDVAKNDNHHG